MFYLLGEVLFAVFVGLPVKLNGLEKDNKKDQLQTKKKKNSGSGGIRTHAIEMTGA